MVLIDLPLYNGCYNCQLACKDEHVNNDWSPVARPQPEIGQLWLRVDQKTCGTLPKLRVNYTPRLCNHCENAACMDACAFGAVLRREDGLVLLGPEKCRGCRACEGACPYGDFWFRDLPVGRFQLYIEAPGFRRRSFEELRTAECLNLGDIPLERDR